MSFGTDILFGLFLIILGVVLWLAVRLTLKSLGGRPSNKRIEKGYHQDETNGDDAEAIIHLQPGGKLLELNQKAYHLFALTKDQTINLNMLAKLVDPTELFYRVCSQPSAFEIKIRGESYLATSYSTSDGILLAIRPFTSKLSNQEPLAKSVLHNLSGGLGEALTASLDLETTIFNSLSKIKDFIPAELIEINLLDDEANYLMPYKLQNGLNDNKPFQAASVEKLGEGFSGKIIQTSEPVWVNDLSEEMVKFSGKEGLDTEFKSYMGFPLLVDHEVLGTLEFYNNRIDGFRTDQRDSVWSVLPQITAAINNAILYKVEKQKADELKSLAQLTQSANYSRNPEDVFDRMLNTIAPSVPVEVIGFLLFDESNQMLEAQRPFVGLPGPFVEIFKTTIKKGSQAEKIIKSHDVLLTENAEVDFHWITLGLDHIARAASIRESVLIPLISGGEIFGFLMAGNHKVQSASFNQLEMRLLMIVANQAAPLIENMLLIQQSDQKARQAETLRKVAVFSNSGADLEEIFSYSIEQLADLYNADCSAIFLLENDASRLSLQIESLFGRAEETPSDNFLAVVDSQYPFTITNSQKPIVIGRFDESEPVVPFYQKFIDSWHLKSVIIVPLIITDESVGELWIGSGKPNQYDFGDVQTLMPAAEQLGLVIEQSKQGDQSKVQWKMKAEKLSALARINREILASEDLTQILQIVGEEAKRIVKASAHTLILFEQPVNDNQVRDILIESGEAPTQEIRGPFTTQFKQEKRVIGPDDHSLGRKNRSTIFYPFEFENLMAGELFLYTQRKKGFSQLDLESIDAFISQVLQSLTASVNVWKQQRTQEMLERKVNLQHRLFALSQRTGRESTIQSVLDPIVAELLSFFAFRVVSVYTFLPQEHGYERIYLSSAEDVPVTTKNSGWIDWQEIELLKNPHNRRKNFYQYQALELPDFFPFDGIENESKTLSSFICPITDFDSQTAGLVLLGYEGEPRISDSTLDILQIFVDQIGLIVENSGTFPLKRNENQELTSGVLIEEAGLETTGLVLTADHRAGFEQLFGDSLFEMLLKMDDIQKFLSLFMAAIIEKTEFDQAILFYENLDGSVRVQEVSGSYLDVNRLDALLGQKNPIESILTNWTSKQLQSTETEDDWQQNVFFQEFKANNYLFLPWQIQSHVRAVLMLVGDNNRLPFTEKQVEYFSGKLKLISYLLNFRTEKDQQTIQLNEIEQLHQFDQLATSLDPEEIFGHLLQTSLIHVSCAQAGWVGIWNENEQVLKPALAKGYRNVSALLRIRFTGEVWAIPSIVMENHEVLHINDLNFARNYPLLPEDLVHYQSATGGPLPIGNILVPLFYEDRNFGVLVLENFDGSYKFTDGDVSRVSMLGQHTSRALHHAYLYHNALLFSENMENQRDQLLLQLSIMAATSEEGDAETNISTSLDLMREAVNAELAILFNLNTKKLYQSYPKEQNRGIESASLSDDSLEKIGASLSENDETLMLDEIYKHEEWVEKIGSEFPYLSLVSLPLKFAGERIAVLLFAHSEPFHFSKDDQQLLESVKQQFGQLVFQTNLQNLVAQQLDHLAVAEVEKTDIVSRSQAVLDALQDGVMISDSQNVITFINHTVEKILDLPYSAFQNTSIMDLAAKCDGCLENWKNTILLWTDNMFVLNIDKQFTEKVHLESQRIIAVQAAPILWNAQYLGAVTMLRDITVEAQVDRMKTEFIANVSHELRTPLTSIKGYADVMLMGATGAISDQQRRFLTIIKNNSSRLNILVDNLLDIANIENDKINFDLRAVYLDKILNQLIKEFQARSEQENKSVQFELKIPRNLKPVRADAKRLQQVLAILMENSYQYSHSGGKVIVRLNQSATETQIDIQDFGIGIKKEYQDRVFERFFRGEEELILATSGTGLGLAVAKSLVEMQGGQIWFYSSGIENEGCVFSFTTPIYFQELD